ncbi:MAG TPA: hypothetical protein VNY05_45985 [Candidatus Acidoferrales bacterium]|jgi:hypothetical protein|nr:hypothetical protein [Candidatus Acidoferrales bacterium]
MESLHVSHGGSNLLDSGPPWFGLTRATPRRLRIGRQTKSEARNWIAQPSPFGTRQTGQAFSVDLTDTTDVSYP